MDLGSKATSWALVALIVGLLTWHFTTVAALQLQVRELTISNAQLLLDKVNLTFANTELRDSLEEQSARVRVWETDAAKRKLASEEALAKAVKEGEAWKSKYKTLLSAPPSNPDDQAASLEERFTDYLNERASQ